ncbi:MAG: hypothetical protein AAFN93_19380, partial [Bacteroidota bacterium]
EITPYVNVFNKTPDKEGFSQFMDSPRYSTGYTTLFGTLGFMIETHMLKPFDIRVKASYDFLETVLEIAKSDGIQIKSMRKKRLSSITPGTLHPIAWTVDKTNFRPFDFKGFEGEMRKSQVTGKDRLYYDRKKPFTKRITYYNTYKPTKEVVVPKIYVIPQGWHDIMFRLKNNGVKYHTIKSDSTIEVEAYRITDFNTASNPYEGHYLHNQVEVERYMKTITLRAGDFLIDTQQLAVRYLIETLEPEAPDSFFAWNFFDTILQRKEGFSPYVFEEIAFELLSKDSKLKANFEKRKTEDTDFASNWYAQLDFIYKRSPHYEKAHMEYPIYRIK